MVGWALHPPNSTPHGRFVDHLVTQHLKQRPATGLQRKPDELREQRVGRRNPRFPDQPQQRPNPRHVARRSIRGLDVILGKTRNATCGFRFVATGGMAGSVVVSYTARSRSISQIRHKEAQ